MSDMWRNEYGAPAGKGFKSRKRLRIEEITPKKLNVKPKDTRKRYEQSPVMERRKKKQIEMSEAYHTVIGVKARIRLLVIDRDASYLDICEIMKREDCPVSGVTIGNVRRDTLEVMKLLEKEGLLDVEALNRRRKRLKKGEA